MSLLLKKHSYNLWQAIAVEIPASFREKVLKLLVVGSSLTPYKKILQALEASDL